MQTNERYAQFVEERNRLMNEDRSEYDWYQNLIPGAEKTLTEYAFSLETENIPAFITFFIRQYWFEANLMGFAKYQSNESTYFYWRRLLTHNETKTFAYICVRLASIDITEAEVERLFSIHKSMFNGSVRNLGTATFHHRCNLHLTKKMI